LPGEIGAVYLGVVLAGSRVREFRIEYAGIVLVTALATIGPAPPRGSSSIGRRAPCM